jgi:hypothetical protein
MEKINPDIGCHLDKNVVNHGLNANVIIYYVNIVERYTEKHLVSVA